MTVKRYSSKKETHTITGTLLFQPSGKAFFIADDLERNEKDKERWVVRRKDTGVAMHEDRVEVRKVSAQLAPRRVNGRFRKSPLVVSGNDKAPAVSVVRVVERARQTITGTLKRGAQFYYVVPDNPRIVQDITVNTPAATGLSPKPRIDDKVIVQLKEWRHSHLNPEGKIIEVLGQSHTPKAEQAALLHEFSLSETFPLKVRAEANVTPQKVLESQIEGRLDYRKSLTFTIDPDDAKDFDDAFSFDLLPSGKIRIGIHIADVSSYVKPDSALDNEARRRGNSTYLVGKVIPMLPAELSNGICSLVEEQDRLTKSVILTLSADGIAEEPLFANTVIHSDKRLTYGQAYALLKEDRIEKVKHAFRTTQRPIGSEGRPFSSLPEEELKTLQTAIRTLWKFAAALREKRMKKGGLELGASEVKIYLDTAGYATHMEQIKDDESHQLVEEFMLLANEHVCRRLSHEQLPLLHRVHDKPNPKDLDELREYLATFQIKTGDLSQRAEVVKLLKVIKLHPQHHTLRTEFLRKLQKAAYRADADGHYGLNKVFYSHFTSPIRRYADLVVHRIFDTYLVRKGYDSAPRDKIKGYKKSQLIEIAQHISRTEINSMEAERQSVKLKLLEYFERELKRKEKTIFEAIISDIRSHGIFVELTESMAWGFVAFHSMRKKGFSISPNNDALVHDKTRRVYRPGYTIGVTLEAVDRFKRQIDFQLA